MRNNADRLNASLSAYSRRIPPRFSNLIELISMINLQKTTQNAIAAMSRLAELYSDPTQVATSRDIAESRNLPIPLVAKILTELSRGGLVTASPGPGGGYRLARKPSEISLIEVVALFERQNDLACPYGPGWCGNREPCPLHHSLIEMQKVLDDYLENTTFNAFAQSISKRPTKKSPVKKMAATQRKPAPQTK